MARGWESKAVEDQQQEAQRAPATPGAVDPADAQRQAERDTLKLARTRALADLQQACAPPYRAMLEAAIRDLDARLSRLG